MSHYVIHRLDERQAKILSAALKLHLLLSDVTHTTHSFHLGASMLVLLVYTAIVFLVAGVWGFSRYKAGVWGWVDCLYYPLAAIGVILFFHNNSGQLQEIEAIQDKQFLQQELVRYIANQPRVHIDIDSNLYTSYLTLIGTIPGLAAVCPEASSTPACEAAQKLSPMIKKFLNTANANADLPIEKRLLSTCNAAESMLLELEASGELLPSTSRELIGNYKAIAQKIWDWERRMKSIVSMR